MLVGGPDTWHPNAEMFYRAGGGPLLDIAPYYLTAIVSLLGPITKVAGFAQTPTPERVLGAGPRSGEVIVVDVPTHAAVVLELERGGLVTLTVSFEARDQYLSGLVVYGTTGSLVLPDANAFGGDVILRSGRHGGEQVTYESQGPARDAWAGDRRARRVTSRRSPAPRERRAGAARARSGRGRGAWRRRAVRRRVLGPAHSPLRGIPDRRFAGESALRPSGMRAGEARLVCGD